MNAKGFVCDNARQVVRVSLMLALVASGFLMEACNRRNSPTQTSVQPTPIPAAYVTTNNNGGTGASTQPGTEVTLTILRDGRERQVRVTLGEFTTQSEQRR
ncbi:MAG TPA: hypothetical protein VGC66_16265 [Pyrinomonadaceae bacterium]